MHEIIDIHPHVISPDTDRYPLTPLGGKQSGWSAAHPVAFETLIEEMDKAGIAKAAVVQASTAYGHNNIYLAEAVKHNTDRLTGVFSVDVLADDAVEKIDFWRGRGLSGMRLFTTGTTMEHQADWLNDPRSFVAWGHASEIGLPICVQMRPEGIPRLKGMLERFPNVVVILDHLARSKFHDGPPYSLADSLWSLADHGNVYLKMTQRALDSAAEGPGGHAAFLEQVVSKFGADRIAWGSNFPAAGRPLAELVEDALDAFSTLNDQDAKAVMSGTALKLYPSLKRTNAAA